MFVEDKKVFSALGLFTCTPTSLLKSFCAKMTVCDRVIVHLREITMGCEEPICANRFWCIEDVCFTSRLSYPMVSEKKNSPLIN